jgi:hypothetical protein
MENDEEEAYPALRRVTVISNDSSSPYERKQLRELLKCVERRRASVPVVELIRRLRPPGAE